MSRLTSFIWREGFLVLLLVSSSACGRRLLSSSKEENNDVNNNNNNNNNNMNGDYVLSATPNSNSNKMRHRFPKRYADYPAPLGTTTKFVDLYSPEISTLYSQVYWKRMESVSFPSQVIKEFDGKTMAIVGFEVDQVIHSAGGKDDISVPITVAYNHHFESTVLGKNSKLTRVKVTDDDLKKNHNHMHNNGHGHITDKDGYTWIVEDNDMSTTNDNNNNNIPNHQDLGAANGGEFRKSFHGFAPGYAKLVQSPVALSITPMQIDTWNRDAISWEDIINGNVTGKFVPGPEPRNSLAPTEGAMYSGLLECPVTTRITKNIEGLYDMKVSSTCGSARKIETPQDCYDAIGNLTSGLDDDDDKHKQEFLRKVVNSTDLPSGCVAITKSFDNKVTGKVAIFNEMMNTHVDCGSKRGGNNKNRDRDPILYTGHTKSLVDLDIKLDMDNDIATVKLTGPSDVWFGVGFNASRMADKPWAVTVEGGTGKVTERQLGDQGGGGTTTVLPSSITIVSNKVDDTGKRTVVFTRKIQGNDERYYTFDKDVTNLNFINAIGSTSEISYHKQKTAAMITILPRNGESICICSNPPPPFGKARGSLMYQDGTSVGFNNNCQPSPTSDLLDQRNPTCDIRTYAGGQIACHHMWSLLDADQDIPWQDEPLKYHLKFRIWYQEYEEEYHKAVYRTTWGIASPVEYDVPQCAPGTPSEKCIHTITGTFHVDKPADGKTMRLVAAHFHCHAPTCLSIELYNNKTGELLCREKSIVGNGHNSDAYDEAKAASSRFEEKGFIAVPPCIWGSSEYGLEQPPVVSGQTLHAIKTANSTYGHHGEMAWLQVLYTLEDDDDDDNNNDEDVQVVQ